MRHERITADDVRVGDRIARSRSHPFREVERIEEGPVSRRFLYVPTAEQVAWHAEHGGPIARSGREHHVGHVDRPRRTAKWWREVSS